MIIDNLVKKLQNCWDGKKLTSWKILLFLKENFFLPFQISAFKCLYTLRGCNKTTFPQFTTFCKTFLVIEARYCRIFFQIIPESVTPFILEQLGSLILT